MAKVIQITDCHLGETPQTTVRGRQVADQLQAVVAHVQQHHADAELVLATGDLVHETLQLAPYQWLHQQLTRITPNIAYIPGNHDCWATMCQALPAATTLPYRLLGDSLGNWQIITLNSNIPVWEPEGRIGGTQLAWLDAVLRCVPEKPALIAVHHHPVAMMPWMEGVKLLDRDALWEVLTRHTQVKGVCWGHVHQAFDGEHLGVTLMATPATSMQFSDTSDEFEVDEAMPIGYRVIELAETLSTQVERLIL